MKRNWLVDSGMGEFGTVQHITAPKFSAQWKCGEIEDEDQTPDLWKDPDAANVEESLRLFRFTWQDGEPDPVTAERLMIQAAKAIDSWVVERM